LYSFFILPFSIDLNAIIALLFSSLHHITKYRQPQPGYKQISCIFRSPFSAHSLFLFLFFTFFRILYLHYCTGTISQRKDLFFMESNRNKAHTNEPQQNTYTQSVTGIVIRDHKVLLARHTYGVGKNRLIVPGGYLEPGETPQEALRREYLEETSIVVEPKQVIGIRFNQKDWYVAFAAEYVSGTASSDHDENSEVLWLDVDEALTRDDVPDLTKKLIQCALKSEHGFVNIPYDGTRKYGEYSFYGIQ